MKKQQDVRRPPRLFPPSSQSDKSGLLKAGTFSLLLHIGFFVIFSLSMQSMIGKMSPSVYRVTLRPLLGDGLPKGGSGPPGSEELPASLPSEKLKHVEEPRTEESKGETAPPPAKKQKINEDLTRNERIEGLKRSSKKGETLEKEKSYKQLQEALEEIRKRAAIDKIQKRVTRREELEKRSTTDSSQGPIISHSGNLTGSGSGTGTGTGSGTGAGSGTGTGSGKGTGSGGSSEGSPWGSPLGSSYALESKLNEYYNMIWAKIKKEWTLPGDFPKGRDDIETTIVVIIEKDGKIQKSWFEKRSGNALYDQMAMRAIKKADPLPPIPKEFSDNTFEIGIRFHPE